MRRALLISVCFLGLPLAASAAEPVFHEKPIASLEDCHSALEGKLPQWRNRPDVKIRDLSGGRQVIDMCTSSGVTELFCDPKAKNSVLAILEGETLPVCKDQSPELPVRDVDRLVEG